MKYVGKKELTKYKQEELDKLGDYAEISDEAAAIIEEIKIGFERLRLSTIMSR